MIRKQSYQFIETILTKLIEKLLLEYRRDNDFDLTIINVIGGDLGEQAIADYHRFLNNNYKLIYPISTIVKIIRTKGYSTEYIGREDVLQFLSVVLEYITLEILTLSGYATTDNNKMMISYEFVEKAIYYDDELNRLIVKIYGLPIEELIDTSHMM